MFLFKFAAFCLLLDLHSLSSSSHLSLSLSPLAPLTLILHPLRLDVLSPSKKDLICLDVSGKSSLKGAAKSLGYREASCLFSPFAG